MFPITRQQLFTLSERGHGFRYSQAAVNLMAHEDLRRIAGREFMPEWSVDREPSRSRTVERSRCSGTGDEIRTQDRRGGRRRAVEPPERVTDHHHRTLRARAHRNIARARRESAHNRTRGGLVSGGRGVQLDVLPG